MCSIGLAVSVLFVSSTCVLVCRAVLQARTVKVMRANQEYKLKAANTIFLAVNQTKCEGTRLTSQGQQNLGSSGRCSKAVFKRRVTEEGYRIFEEDELGIDKGGNTKLCPFDCDCCF